MRQVTSFFSLSRDRRPLEGAAFLRMHGRGNIITTAGGTTAVNTWGVKSCRHHVCFCLMIPRVSRFQNANRSFLRA